MRPSMAMAAAVHPTAEGLARLGELREEAYTKVLRAFTQQTFHWVRLHSSTLVQQLVVVGSARDAASLLVAAQCDGDDKLTWPVTP